MGTKEAQGGLYSFSSGAEVIYEYSPGTGIEFSKSAYEFLLGQETILPLTLSDETSEVEWKSDNEDVATVSAEGKVVAKNYGVAKIVATIKDSDKSAECMVYVGGGVNPGKIIYDSFGGTISVSAREAGTLYVVTYIGGILRRVNEYDIPQGVTEDVCSFEENQKAFLWDENLKPLCDVFALSQGGSIGGVSGGGI